MLNKKIGIIILVLAITVISTVGIVLAEDDSVKTAIDNGEDGNCTEVTNNTYIIKAVNDSNNNAKKEYKGFTLNSSLNKPNTEESKEVKITQDISSIDDRVKEVIVRYYRHFNTPAENLAIQDVIWKLMNPDSTGNLSPAAQWLYDSLGVLKVGEHQSYDGGVNTYDFTFYLGTPYGGENSDSVSPLILFTYAFSSNPIKHNPSGGEHDYVDPTKVNPEGTDDEDDNSDSNLNPGDNDTSDNPTNDSSKENSASSYSKDLFSGEASSNNDNSLEELSQSTDVNAAMKNTGLPLIAVLMSIFAIIGFSFKRK